jgi:cytochrome c2
MVLERGHIFRRLTTTKAHKRIFETLLVFLWCEACHHLKQGEQKKRGGRKNQIKMRATPLQVDARHHRAMRVHRREGERTQCVD